MQKAFVVIGLFASLLLFGADTELSRLAEQSQSVKIVNKATQPLTVWKKITWESVAEQKPPAPENNSIANLAYRTAAWLFLPQPPRDTGSTTGGTVEHEVRTLHPGESLNLAFMLCTKIGEGYYRKRTGAAIVIRKPQPSGSEWGPVICSQSINTDPNLCYEITENGTHISLTLEETRQAS